MPEQVPHRHTTAASAVIAPSLLRLSVTQRLGIAAAMAVVLWIAVAWALLWTAA